MMSTDRASEIVIEPWKGRIASARDFSAEHLKIAVVANQKRFHVTKLWSLFLPRTSISLPARLNILLVN